MGWTGLYRRVEDPVAFLKEELFGSTGDPAWDGKREVVAASKVGSTVYMAVKVAPDLVERLKLADEYEPDADGSITAAMVILTSKSRGEFRYKDMGETMGPCERTAPLSFLAKLSPLKEGKAEWAHGWRAGCREHAARAKRRLKLSEGAMVKLAKPVKFSDGTEQAEFRVETYLRRGRKMKAFRGLNGGLYRVSASLLEGAEVS